MTTTETCSPGLDRSSECQGGVEIEVSLVFFKVDLALGGGCGLRVNQLGAGIGLPGASVSAADEDLCFGLEANGGFGPIEGEASAGLGSEGEPTVDADVGLGVDFNPWGLPDVGGFAVWGC